MPRRSAILARLLAIIPLAAACGEAGPEDPTAVTVLDPTVVTVIWIDAQVSWEPPEDPSPAAREEISQALKLDRPLTEQVRPVLLPGPIPDGAGIEGATSATLRVTHTSPEVVVAADVAVLRSDGSVVLSISSYAADNYPVCRPGRGASWVPATVRGLPGCSYVPDMPGAVRFAQWAEAGGDFHAEFGAETPLDGVLAWLEAWHPPTG